MAFTKFASLENAEVLGIKGSQGRARIATLDKFADFEDYRTEDGYLYARIRAISSRVNKNHDGWPSVELAGGQDVFNRISGVKTGSVVLAADSNQRYGYSTFLGKPIFVDHHNSNPERARGVIVDSKLHVDDHKTAAADDHYYANAPDNHMPPTWVELLLEIDAKSFPKLAKAIIEGSQDSDKGIDGFSMGCDVERSVCSHCSNTATTPDDYCEHVRMKGAEFPYTDANGRTSSKKSYEDCYGIKFFEISAVFDPADETALLREIRAHTAAGNPYEDDPRLKEKLDIEMEKGVRQNHWPEDLDNGQISLQNGETPCASCGNSGRLDAPGTPLGWEPCPNCEEGGRLAYDYPPQGMNVPGHNPQGDGYYTPHQIGPDQATMQVAERDYNGPRYQGSTQGSTHTAAEHVNPQRERICSICGAPANSGPGGCPDPIHYEDAPLDDRYYELEEQARRGGGPYRQGSTVHTAEAPPPQVDELKMPEPVDTLREETVCPVCGSDMDSETCDVCGFQRPPEGMDNPDLSKAQPNAQESDSQKLQEDQEDHFDGLPANGGEEGLDQGSPNKDATFAHVTNDMSWKVSTTHESYTNPATETPVVPNAGPATDEPKSATVKKDHSAPVTSNVRTAEDFLAAADAQRRTMSTEKTADAASGAPEAATPDKNVDVDAVGGALEATNEDASKADAQIDVEGEGTTGTSDVSADKTESVDQGDEHSKNIEEIHTKTWDNGSGVEEQRDPVGGPTFPATSSWQVQALDSEPYPAEDGGLSGGGAQKGTEPADPVGKAEDRVDVLDATTSPENNSGETKTWSGTDGNGVTRQQEPVTNETLEGEDIVNLSPSTSSTHVFAALKLAEAEVELGITQQADKFNRAEELEKLSPEELQAESRVVSRVKTAGLAKRNAQKQARRMPQLGRKNASVEKEAAEEKSTDIPDASLFLK